MTADHASGRPVHWLPDRERAAEIVAGLALAGDLVIAMGAGDVDRLGRALIAGGPGDG
jgi:UDP-N-acetylmuramate--alanine ligase